MTTAGLVRCSSFDCYIGNNALYAIGRGVFGLIFLMFFFCSGFVLRLAVEVFVFKCRTLHVC